MPKILTTEEKVARETAALTKETLAALRSALAARLEGLDKLVAAELKAHAKGLTETIKAVAP